ncbi:metal-dependent hydrolase [Parasedimentitalea huanghaiensis]|uniref:Metal-dependent hydrolase n=1 Tax=Parasedimentitalea huanghaiensis TaxID=2682100 RepID=A0A6L6WI20_9RHOB|nr:metal-dependent hydrolase [Zongyanglinia huanghaiensis]MVO16245.1 metal-dependent hydrolase [Zongyanglinia huanghaiensis]
MFIAHLPAGYLTANLLARKHKNRSSLIAVGLVCSILPDFDLLWFYLVDNRQTAHHEYFFHWPLFWCFLAFATWILSWILGQGQIRRYILVALTCLLVHMLLDSFAAEIYWLRPFSDFHLNAVEVPAKFEWWVWSFVFHWTFAVEIGICLAAAIVFLRNKKNAI